MSFGIYFVELCTCSIPNVLNSVQTQRNSCTRTENKMTEWPHGYYYAH